MTGGRRGAMKRGKGKRKSKYGDVQKKRNRGAQTQEQSKWLLFYLFSLHANNYNNDIYIKHI